MHRGYEQLVFLKLQYLYCGCSTHIHLITNFIVSMRMKNYMHKKQFRTFIFQHCKVSPIICTTQEMLVGTVGR